MSTSGNAAKEDHCASVIRAYLFAAVGCAMFGAIYELFSHEVYSCFMICSFAFPLLLGALPFFLLKREENMFSGSFPADLVHAGVAALTAGSIMQGVLEIYGTTNPLVLVYWVVGAVLTAVGWLLVILKEKTAS